MRKFLKVSVAVFAVAVILIFIHKALFPLVYAIKEPRFLTPVDGKIVVRNDNYGEGDFGAKRKNGRRHKGLDIAAKVGSPVYASKSGWARTCYVPEGYGNLVVINHPGRYQTRYWHLKKCAIKKFQWVRQGEVIGFVGKTGNAGPRRMVSHLHFEIRKKGKPIDPAEEIVKQ